MIYAICTQHNELYYAVEKGDVYALISANLYHEGKRPSGQWYVIGFRERLPFGRMGPLVRLHEMSKRTDNGWCRFGNGKGKFRMEDMDYGSRRLWGEPIIAVYPIENV